MGEQAADYRLRVRDYLFVGRAVDAAGDDAIEMRRAGGLPSVFHATKRQRDPQWRRMTPTIEIKLLDPRLSGWGLPRYQSAHAAAIDLHACLDEALTLPPGAAPTLISAGFAVHIADPHIAALVLPRSGMGHKRGLVLGNLVGLIDPDYTGPIMVSAWNRGTDPVSLSPGERFAQMMFVPVIRPVLCQVDAFSAASERGEGGFGSTG